MDEGHSVHVSDFTEYSNVYPAAACLLDALDLPDWVTVRIDLGEEGTVDVGDYTIVWHLNGEFIAADVLVYEREVGGGQR